MNPKLINLVNIISSSALHDQDHCNITPNKSIEEYAELCEGIVMCEHCPFADIVDTDKFNSTLDAFNEHKNSNSNSND